MTRYLMTLGISIFLSIVMILWLFKISSPGVRKAHTKILVDEMTRSLGFASKQSEEVAEMGRTPGNTRLGNEHNAEAAGTEGCILLSTFVFLKTSGTSLEV